MSVDELLKQVASHGLPEQPAAFLAVPLGDRQWTVFLDGVRRQRLIGFLKAAVDAERVPVTDGQSEAVDELHLQACGSMLRMERRLLELVHSYEAAGIEVVVLKGTASAHLNYDEPSMRVFADNDLLVRPADFQAALVLARRLGYRRLVAPPRPTFDRRYAKGATLKGAEGAELDLHRNLVFGTFGFMIDLEELFASTIEFQLGGRRLRALGPETRLLHACYHAALGDPDPRYSSLRDVAQMLSYGDHDRARVLELVSDWEAWAVVARAVGLCDRHLGVRVTDRLVDAVAGYKPTDVEDRAIASYVGENRHYAAKVRASLPFLPTAGERAAFLRAAAVPSSAFVRSRGDEPRAAWVRRGVRSLFQDRVEQ